METMFKIKNVKVLSTWIYNLKNNTDCTICRSNLNENSIYADNKNEDSVVVSGICGHSFHKECINNWIKSNNQNKNCPICFLKWQNL